MLLRPPRSKAEAATFQTGFDQFELVCPPGRSLVRDCVCFGWKARASVDVFAPPLCEHEPPMPPAAARQAYIVG
jgi:hypothetical protein